MNRQATGKITWRALLQTLRPAAQSYIFIPLLLGQGIHYAAGGRFDPRFFLLIHLCGLFLQWHIVLANDYADRETDAANRTSTPFSGGSRTIPQGKLRPESIRRGAVLTALLTLATGAILAWISGRPLVLLLSACGPLLIYLYSYRPAELSYRGGGELLQLLGVGVVLPLLGYHAQGGRPADFPWALLGALLPSQAAVALAGALPDEPSDRLFGKRTLVVLLGEKAITVAVITLQLLGMFALILGAGNPLLQAGMIPLLIPAPAITFALGFFAGGRPGSGRLAFFVGLVIAHFLWLWGGTALLLFRAGG